MRLISYLLMSLLLIAITSQLVDASNVNLNQERPRLKYQRNNYISSGKVMFGNNSDSKFEMLSTKFTTSNSMLSIQGDPVIEVIGPIRLNISGTFIKEVNVNSRTIGSYFEVNDYLEQYNELERYRTTDTQHFSESDNSFETEFNVIRPSFSFFQNNDSFVKVENQRSGVTAFILRTGSINDIKLNNTDGAEIGNIFSFRININIFYFDSLSQQLRGVYQTKDFGFGNVIPERIILYLKSNDFIKKLDHGSIGEKLFENYSFSNIEWINSGLNSTLGLNIYSGLYFFSRDNSFLIFDSVGNSNSLELNQIEDEFEEFQDDLINTNLIDAFSDDLLTTFENELSENILSDGGVTITNIINVDKSDEKIPNIENLYNENIFFTTQLLALLIVSIVLIRRKKNS